MNQNKVCLSIPAQKAYVPVASLALSGLGMVLGLDVDLLGDLRTVAAESLDCLMNQAGRPSSIQITAEAADGRLNVRFCSCDRERTQRCDELSVDITRGVLETLMPCVELSTDEDGVHGIECSMPV